MLRYQSKRMCRSEYVAYKVYSYIGKYVARGKVRDALARASSDELRHYHFWRSVGGECGTVFLSLKVFAYFMLALLFGITVTMKMAEFMEGDSARLYEELAKVDPSRSDELLRLADEERRHEEEFIGSIDEARVRYLSSITLGVSDAIIELTGIYLGALGALASAKTAGLIGLLAGVSASASMATASYAQAKHEVWKKPYLAAIFTGVSYILVALLLAIPYFVVDSLVIALTLTLATAVGVIAYISLYSSVLLRKSYLKEFLSNTALLLGISLALYLLGRILGLHAFT